MKQKWIFFGAGLILSLTLVAAIWAALIQGEKSPIYVAGRVTLDPSLIEDAKDISTLYIILHDAQSQRPIPFAAFRHKLKQPASSDPSGFYEFVLTPDNTQLMPSGSGATPKFFRLKARLDLDGAGGAAEPGDLLGELSEIPLGAQNLDLRITSKLR